MFIDFCILSYIKNLTSILLFTQYTNKIFILNRLFLAYNMYSQIYNNIGIKLYNFVTNLKLKMLNSNHFTWYHVFLICCQENINKYQRILVVKCLLIVHVQFEIRVHVMKNVKNVVLLFFWCQMVIIIY